MHNYVENILKTKSYCIWSCNIVYDQQVITQQGEQLEYILWPCGRPHPSMRTSADIRIHPCGRPQMSTPIHADVHIDVCKDGRACPQRCPHWCPQMSADLSADVHMEILRMSAQKKFPAWVDLRTQRSNTPQTYAGKCPQFSMRNIPFFGHFRYGNCYWNFIFHHFVGKVGCP